MHSNGFYSSSGISEKRRARQRSSCQHEGKSGMKENWSERLKDENSAEQGIFGEVKEKQSM